MEPETVQWIIILMVGLIALFLIILGIILFSTRRTRVPEMNAAGLASEKPAGVILDLPESHFNSEATPEHAAQQQQPRRITIERINTLEE